MAHDAPKFIEIHKTLKFVLRPPPSKLEPTLVQALFGFTQTSPGIFGEPHRMWGIYPARTGVIIPRSFADEDDIMGKCNIGPRVAVIATCFWIHSAHGEAPAEAVGPIPTSNQNASAGSIGAEDSLSDWRFATQLSATATYDDNVFIEPNDGRRDIYFHLAPTVAVGIGAFRAELSTFADIPHLLLRTGEEDLPHRDFAFASYTPDAVVFSKYHDENTVNHDLRLAARKERELWNAQGQLRYRRIEDVSIDVGHRLRQTYYTADASGSHALSGKTNAALSFTADRSEYSGDFSSTDVHGRAGVDYQIAPKTAIGLAGGVGYLDVARGGNQTYQQALLQLRYDPTGKLSFVGHAGEEFRQFKGHVPNRSRFVFDVNGNYQVSDSLSATLSARRDTTSSAQYSGENIVADTYQAGARQRVFTRFYAGLAGGYVHNRYENNREVAVISRRDAYTFEKASLARDITTRGTIELSYEHRNNDSTISNFGFTQNIASLGVSLGF
jgi:hypothetical protein